MQMYDGYICVLLNMAANALELYCADNRYQISTRLRTQENSAIISNKVPR